jgi:hypothetical protein
MLAYSRFYLDAPRITRHGSAGKLPKSSKDEQTHLRAPKIMGHYRRTYVPKPTMPVRVQDQAQRRSVGSYIRYGLLGKKVHGINKKISDTYKYAQYTYLGLDFFL